MTKMNMTLRLITHKIKVEPGIQPRVQGTSPEVPAPPHASEVDSVASGAVVHPSTPPTPIPDACPTVHLSPSASEISSVTSGAAACLSALPSAGLPSTLAPIPGAHPTVHLPPGASEIGSLASGAVHGIVPPAGVASLPVGDGGEERENVGLLANPEDDEEDKLVEDDGGIAEVAEVADEVVWAKDIFQVPGGLQPPLPYVPQDPHDIDNFPMAELLFFTNDINPANDQEAGMISL